MAGNGNGHGPDLLDVNPFRHPDGAILVRKSRHSERPWYLQRVINAWEEARYYGQHALVGEEFATREEAEARAEALRRGVREYAAVEGLADDGTPL